MTVKRLLYWKPNQESAINSHTVNKISECVKAFNGVKERAWKTDLRYYRSILPDQSNPARHALGLYFMGNPNKYYLIISKQNIVVEADPSILTILDKLHTYFSTIVLYFEGVDYKLGDFQMKLVKVLTRYNYLRGILMEATIF
ncbi:mediator of RNA polymerase II transcription subunit 20a [Lathyrus oleraceus]|uniref:mediator of RNA polymerase II transcription subunit 20a n=1 Tax=Pisum sativum TaxID=3888 RepID=UPI0021D11C59|nr:mediator of RNA polymerase II transcription subunit 20a-like [Pisum sativum]